MQKVDIDNFGRYMPLRSNELWPLPDLRSALTTTVICPV
jgi:hypothetical protein